MEWATRVGSSGDDRATGAAVDPQGSIFITGTFQDTVSFDLVAQGQVTYSAHGQEDVLLCKESEVRPAEELCGAPCGATDASQRTCDSPAAVATAAEEEEAMDSFVQYVYPLPP